MQWDRVRRFSTLLPGRHSVRLRPIAIRKWVPTMWIFFIGKNLEIHPKLKRNKSFDALRSTVEMGMLMYNTYSHLIPINIGTQTIISKH